MVDPGNGANHLLGLASGGEVAVVVGKADNAIGVGYIYLLRILA
jgi:hypothetical protein